MDQPPFSFWQRFVLLLVAAYAPGFWLPALGPPSSPAAFIFPLTPIVLPWLLLDRCFPLMPYGQGGFYAAGIALLVPFLVLVVVLAEVAGKSRTSLCWVAGILAVTSFVQGIVFSFWVRGLA